MPAQNLVYVVLAAAGWFSAAPPPGARFGSDVLRDRTEEARTKPVPALEFDDPAGAPMVHTRFCLRYPNDCRVPRIVFRGGATKLTAGRRAELTLVNTMVNRAIQPDPSAAVGVTARWFIAPKTGDCGDYVVTKRHQLLERGWPARNLLLAEVVIPSGAHHLVLLVRTEGGDLVADNLNANVRPWTASRYRWLRVQSPRNPLFWRNVAPPFA